MEEWGWLIALVGSLGAAGAAIAAWKSAKATRKTVLAQIVIQITGTYSSPEMFESIKNLYDWKRGHGTDFATVFGNRLRDRGHADAVRLDGDRRRVSHYFHQIRALLDCGVVNENFVKKLVKSDQVDTLLDIVEPLEEAKNSNYDHSTFDIFRKIYRKDNTTTANSNKTK